MQNNALRRRVVAPSISRSKSRTRLPKSLPFHLLAALLLGLAAGYRLFGEGRDFYNYEEFYRSIGSFQLLDFSRFELGFVWVAATFNLLIESDLNFFIAALATISLVVKFSIFSEHQRPLPTALFYLACWYPVHEYSQIRAAVAFALVFLSVEALFQGRKATFAALVGLASLFHSSSLVLLIAIPAAYAASALSLPLIVAIAGGSLIALVAVREELLVWATAIFPMASFHAANSHLHTHVNLLSGANLLVVALLASMLFASSIANRREKTLFTLTMFGLVSAVAFQELPVFSHRLREMFLIFLVPLAFNFKWNSRSLPQAGAAVALALWSFYVSISDELVTLIP